MMVFQCDLTIKQHHKVRPNPHVNLTDIMDGVHRIESRLRQINDQFEVVWSIPIIRKFTKEESVSRIETRQLAEDIRRLSNILRESGRCVFDLSINFQCGERRTTYSNRLIPDGIHQSPAGSTRLLKTLGRMLISKGTVCSIMRRRGINVPGTSREQRRLTYERHDIPSSGNHGPLSSQQVRPVQEDNRSSYEETDNEVPQWMEDQLFNMY